MTAAREPFDESPSAGAADYDAVVIGGGFAGSATALLLRRWLPSARILIAERSQRFERKVGEATVEVSGFFLHRVLGLYDHLSRHHLPKHGLRYWFSDGGDRSLEQMSEVGPQEMPHVPSFQLDRHVLDQHLLETAAGEGCEVLRPAKVTAVGIDRPRSTVTLRSAGGERTVTARWVIDGSGRQSFLARKLGLRVEVDEHPTAALWARWQGALDLDGDDVLGGDVRQPRLEPVAASRRLATNHFVGYGFWCWVIPLSGGETSIGVVYNKELYQPPGDGTLRERYERFVRETPGLRELVQDAEIATADGRADFMALQHLPYTTRQYMDHGWALVGDAASFLDPYYSPGLDHAAMSIYATARLVEKQLRGELAADRLQAAIDLHNADFTGSYRRWLEALYLGKYELMGDADLVRCAFLFDTALYYLGVVTPVYRDIETLGNPVFLPSVPQSAIAWKIMRAVNRRLVGLARFRRRAGLYGERNLGLRAFSSPFGLGPAAALRPLRTAAKIWLRLEWQRLVHRLRGGRREVDLPAPEPSAG